MNPSRRFFVPEVIQSSAMDCGPAALKCLLEGFGVHASYGRLREACQTDVDGTSINTLEDIANLLGLDARQTMLPVDHLFLPGARTLPALIVTRQPGGQTHFLVVWRRSGPLLQLMDPGTGRRWVTTERFLRDVYVHEQALPAAAWRAWAGSASALGLMHTRLRQLGLSKTEITAVTDVAIADDGWRSLATLDAAVRMTQTLVDARAVGKGAQAHALLRTLADEPASLPAHVWSTFAKDTETDTIVLRGAVFVHVAGKKEEASSGLSPELTAALDEKPARPGLALLQLLREDGVLTPLVLAGAMVWVAGGTMIEAVLLRGLFDLGRELQMFGQRLAGYSALVLFVAALLLVELPVASGLLRLGRQLENRLRLKFLQKIPRLGDRYFQSRPKSDMAERSHSLHRIRHLPELGGRLVRSGFELIFTTAGIIWLDPASAPIALGALAAALLLPLAVQPTLSEQDLRLRTHLGAISRFYLDALLGLVAIRTHGAEPPVRQAHRHLLAEWASAGLRFQRTVAGIEGLQLLLGFSFAAWLLFSHFARLGDTGSTLLLVYWALSVPAIAQDLALAAWQYPSFRNITLRLLEPLGALEERGSGIGDQGSGSPSPAPRSPGVSIDMQGVSVRAAGHLILKDVSLRIDAGSHVAIVGRSGAGKSSFVGLLLGWHRAAAGTMSIDDEPLASGVLERLRQETAWVDPEVHLWNRTLLDNLAYGASSEIASRVGDAIERADLREVLERLPAGLQTWLGEGGARVSGGEGQRVRLARAMLRPDARLVILDEPFRGLERQRRERLLEECRTLWKDATILCITHDVGHTQAFDRVLVLEQGRVVEDDEPSRLAERSGTRYRAMLDAEASLTHGLWSNAEWKRLRLRDGQVVDEAGIGGRGAGIGGQGAGIGEAR